MDIKQLIRVRSISAEAADQWLTQQLAQRLQLPELFEDDIETPFFLAFTGGRLSLFSRADKAPPKPLCVDFLTGPLGYRSLRDRRINQPLAKAVGIKAGIRPRVCDATAGLGEDGFVLASLGCRVTMIERSPIVWALLDDGLRRAASDRLLGPVVSERITLLHGDAVTILGGSSGQHDTIFVDPMYPETQRSALNKQKMRTVRTLVGDDADSSDLLNAARKAGPSRIAVKRPARAPTLSPHAPTYSITGKSCRFDVYLPPYL